MKTLRSNLNRRTFLARSAELSVGSATMLATLGGLNRLNAQVSDASGYKALVCVFLFGGNDSYNMVVPRSATEHAIYADARQSLAVARNQLLALSPLQSDGAEYGLHPAMGPVQGLFASGAMAVMANVGALIEPVTREQFGNKSVALPAQLFSHNNQQAFWQAMNKGDFGETGWAGRIADRLIGVNDNPELSLNITLSGSNLWQVGSGTIPYSLTSQGAPLLKHVKAGGSGRDRRRLAAFSALLDGVGDRLFEGEFARVQKRSMAVASQFNAALADASVSTVFPNGPFGNSLAMVARIIAARQSLRQSRQVFFVGLGGWDTHGDQLVRHPNRLQTLSEGLAAFYQATVDLGLTDAVTTFTMSDFGRTLTSNGDGSDHGWGSHQLMLGGSVAGQDIYGEMPMLDIEGPLDAGRGRIIPTTSVDQYGATLARWFGVADSDLAEVFPNLGNFDTADLGFMTA